MLQWIPEVEADAVPLFGVEVAAVKEGRLRVGLGHVCVNVDKMPIGIIEAVVEGTGYARAVYLGIWSNKGRNLSQSWQKITKSNYGSIFLISP